MEKNLFQNLILVCLSQIWDPTFLWVLPLLDVRHVTSYQCFQFKEKLMIQALENGKKPLILALI